MVFLVTIFIVSAVLMSGMVLLKYREISDGERNVLLGAISRKTDPIAGRIIDWSNFFSAEVFSDIFRFFAAKVGIWTAKGLISLRNFSSKLAAHLYHTSRKAQSGDPMASHPSFFIKAILDFKEKLKEDRDSDIKHKT